MTKKYGRLIILLLIAMMMLAACGDPEYPAPSHGDDDHGTAIEHSDDTADHADDAGTDATHEEGDGAASDTMDAAQDTEAGTVEDGDAPSEGDSH